MPQPVDGVSEHGLHVGQPWRAVAARTRHERPPRLRPDLGCQPRPLLFGDIGRVGDDQVDGSPQRGRKRLEPVAQGELHPGQRSIAARALGSHVGRRHLERVGADVDGPDLAQHGASQLRGERQRQRAGARAGVDGHEAGPRDATTQAAGLGQRHPGDLLGLGARDEHARIHQEVEVTKGPVPEHVLQWLPRGPALRQAARRCHHVGVERTRRPVRLAQDEPEAQHLVDDEARFVWRAHDFGELGNQRAARGARRPAHPSPSSSPDSWRPRLSAISASVSSFRSPASTWSSLYRVRLIRWSVTRFSLKLYVRILSVRFPAPT